MKTPKQSKRMKLPNGFGSIVKRTDKRKINHRTSQAYSYRRRDCWLKKKTLDSKMSNLGF